MICEIFLFSIFYSFYLFFFYYWHFIFNFVYLYLSKSSINSYVLLFYGIEILSKNFGKSWNIFQKNIDIINPKFFINSIIYYLFVFYSFSILVIFFPISLIQTCQKILNIFVVLYYTDYRFYQRILENSWIFIKKNRDILNTKHFQNSIVYYLLFNFVIFLPSFVIYFTCLWFSKNYKIFVLFYCMDPRLYQKIEIFEIENFNKISSFTISFFFSIFDILFSNSHTLTYPKIMEFFNGILP